MRGGGEVQSRPDMSPVRLDTILVVQAAVVESDLGLLVYVHLISEAVKHIAALAVIRLGLMSVVRGLFPPDKVMVDLVHELVSDLHTDLQPLLASDAVLARILYTCHELG